MESKKSDVLDLNESQISSIENLDQSIEEKMRSVMPDMIKKIREEIL